MNWFNTKLVCYYNLNEKKWLNLQWIYQTWEVFLFNKNNSSQEVKLCNLIKEEYLVNENKKFKVKNIKNEWKVTFFYVIKYFLKELTVYKIIFIIDYWNKKELRIIPFTIYWNIDVN